MDRAVDTTGLIITSRTCCGQEAQSVNDTSGGRSGTQSCWWMVDQICADPVGPPTPEYVVLASYPTHYPTGHFPTGNPLQTYAPDSPLDVPQFVPAKHHSPCAACYLHPRSHTCMALNGLSCADLLHAGLDWFFTAAKCRRSSSTHYSFTTSWMRQICITLENICDSLNSSSDADILSSNFHMTEVILGKW